MSILETSGFIGAPEFILGRRTTTSRLPTRSFSQRPVRGR